MKTILVVDDDDLLVESLTDLLEVEGYRVVSAENGKDGLARFEKENPDLVLTNFRMPIADGLDLVQGVHALPEFRSLPVVVMSTSHKGVALSPRTVGVSAILGKPFGLEELLAIIERLIGKGEPGRHCTLTVEARPYKARYVVSALTADKVFLLIPWYYQEAARCPAPPPQPKTEGWRAGYGLPSNMAFATRSKTSTSDRARRKVPRYARSGRSSAVGSWASIKSSESVMPKAAASRTNVSKCGMRLARSIIER